MDVFEAIQHKRAIRSFKDEPLPEEVTLKILNAGRRAQSAKNMQAWHFIAIQDRETLKALSGMGNFASHLANAALGIAIITPPPETRFSIMLDAGQAAAYMQLAAWEIGVGSCLATIYEPEKARQLLGFPPELEIHIAISFGYPADATNLSRSPQKGGRKSFNESVHWERW
jgi:nitroreductase